MSAFRSVCDRIRFDLDGATGARALDRRDLPDFVARIRSESLRIGPRTAPGLWRTVERVAERLGLGVEPEVYVTADPNLNAFAPTIASDERPVIVLNSGLVQLLNQPELAFAIGHALGHLGLGHAHRPVSRADNELDALKERSRQRYSELSADRVGLVAAASLLTATTVMVKSASGLPGELLGFDAAAFIAQIEREDGERSREWELDLSHPTLPFRLWALIRFAATREYHELTGGAAEGVPLRDVDAEIAARLDGMGDGRLGEMEESAIDLALTWAGTLIVIHDGIIEDRERDELESLVGPDRARRGLDFGTGQGLDAVRTKLREAFGRMSAVSPAGRRRFEVSLDGFIETLGLTGDAGGVTEVRELAGRQIS